MTDIWPIPGGWPAGALEPALITFFGVVARLSGIVFFLPGIGERVVSPRVRLAFVFALSAIVTPFVMESAPSASSAPADIGLLLVAEVVSGLAIGLAIRILIVALQIAGSITAQHLSLSQMFGAGVGHDAESAFSTLFVMGALALAMASGLHFALVDVIVSTYSLAPFSSFPDSGALSEWVRARWRRRMANRLRAFRAVRYSGFHVQPRAGSREPRDAATHGGLCRRAGDHFCRPCDLCCIGRHHPDVLARRIR